MGVSDLSSTAAELTMSPPAPEADGPSRAGEKAGRVAPAVLAPAVMAGLALLIERFVPDGQEARPSGPYPAVLGGLLAISSATAALAWAWSGFRPWAARNGPLMAGGIGWLAAWDLVTRKLALMPLPYFPGPDAVLRGMVEDRWVLLESAYQSLRLLLAGYAAGVTAGVVSGVLIGWSRRVRYWGMPFLKVAGPIPATAYVPLAMALFSNAFASGAALIAMAVWFPVTMLTASGVANVPVAYLDVAKTLGAGRTYLIFRVAIPAAMPGVFLGLFMGLGASFLTLIVAETVGVRSGLGWYLKWQQGYVEYAKVYAALAIMAAFFSGLMTLLFLIRDRVLGWQKGVIRW